MKTYAALLRGINVSGQKKINMQELKQLLSSLPLEDIVTYIQSGNIVFRSRENDEARLATAIEQQISGYYGFEVPVVIRTIAALQDCMQDNPFLKEADINPDTLYVTFPAIAAGDKLIQITANFPPDRFVRRDRHIYIHCVHGYGNTKLNNNFFERKLQRSATTRNLKTIQALIRLGQPQHPEQ